MSDPWTSRGDPADHGSLPARPADRLHGPEAGWENLHRNLSATAAMAEAELYASGSRRLTVTHHPTGHVGDLVKAVEQAARSAGYSRGGTLTSRHDRTIWTWPCTDVPAAGIVRTAPAEAHRLNPGHWTIHADDH